MKKLNLLLAIIGFVVSASCLAETNFSHSKLSIGGMKTTFDSSICANGECMSSLQGPLISGDFQFSDAFILSVSASYLTDSRQTWSTTVNENSLKFSIVRPIGRRSDLQIGVASLSDRIEVCVDKNCLAATGNGTGVSGQIDFWMDDIREFAGKAGILSVKYSDSYNYTTTFNLGVSFYQLNRNAVTLDIFKKTHLSSIVLSYAYHF